MKIALRTIAGLILGAGIAVVAIVVLAGSAYWERKQPAFQNAPKLIAALHAFSRDLVAAGQPLPPEVSLQDLVGGGYLTSSDVNAFDGMEVTFTPHVDGCHPQLVLARGRTPDGHFICLLADGSVQQLSREKYEQQRTNLGQGSPADGSQPFHSETNRRSGTAGSRRSP
jgi:hypothetical protein